jgi:flagellar biosynthetic protein FliR
MIDIPFLRIMEAFLFIGIRLSGLFLFAPFLGSGVVPPQVKATLVIALCFVLYPLVSPVFPQMPLSHWPIVALGELTVGAAIGIATSVVFDAVQMAGQVLSVQMGYSLINILDPDTQVDSTVVAMFHQLLVMLLFLQMGVQFWLVRAIADSFLYLPPGSAHLGGNFIRTLFTSGSIVIEVGIQIAAPVLSATLLTDIVLGLLGKASPQLPVILLGPAVKSILGVAVLIASLQFWPGIFRSLFSRSFAYSEQLLHLAR